MRTGERITQRLAAKCLAFFVKELPLELKPWGEAMLAELPQASGVYASASWAMGGSMVLSKALVRQWFKGKTWRSASASGPSNVGRANSPSPWQRAALVALLLSLAMGLSPDFRQAVSTSLESWNPAWWQYRAKKVDDLLQSAEKLGDPASLAFVALNTKDPEKAERLAQQAVARDPQLEWVWYPVIQSQLIAMKPSVDVRGPKLAARIRQLETWDPNNAVPYLLDAERTRWSQPGTFNRISPLMPPRDAEQMQSQQAWRSAMEKAFAAPRYNSYFNREMQIERAVLLKLKVNSPLTLVRGIYWHASPVWFNTKQFSDLLLQEGDNALRRGDVKLAGERYWQAAHFAERMRSQAPTVWERLSAAGLQHDSYTKISSLLAATHQDAEKAQIDQALASLVRERNKMDGAKGFWEMLYGPVSAGGIAVSLSVVILFAALALSLAGAGYFFARHWLAFSAPRTLDRVLTMAAQWGPFALAGGCLCLYLGYLPYAHLYAGYLNKTMPAQDSEQLRAFMQIRYVPDMVISFFGGAEGLRIYFWGATVFVLAAPLVVLGWRWSRMMKQGPAHN